MPFVRSLEVLPLLQPHVLSQPSSVSDPYTKAHSYVPSDALMPIPVASLTIPRTRCPFCCPPFIQNPMFPLQPLLPLGTAQAPCP